MPNHFESEGSRRSNDIASHFESEGSRRCNDIASQAAQGREALRDAFLSSTLNGESKPQSLLADSTLPLAEAMSWVGTGAGAGGIAGFGSGLAAGQGAQYMGALLSIGRGFIGSMA